MVSAMLFISIHKNRMAIPCYSPDWTLYWAGGSTSNHSGKHHRFSSDSGSWEPILQLKTANSCPFCWPCGYGSIPIILGTRELGLVKDTPGWTSPISSCAGPPLDKSRLIRCPSENRNYGWFFWFAEKYWFLQESSAAWTARTSWWPRNTLIEIY